MPVLKDLVGQRFARLTVIAYVGSIRWQCVCDCGGASVVGTSDLGHHTRSCGCLKREIASARMRSGTVRKRSRRFGGAKFDHPREFSTWSDMVRRCTRPTCKAFPDYGGRGISVCDRWREDFPAFLADMGARPSDAHSIDRVNNDGNYEPGNCRWALKAQQVRNTRNNRHLTIDGETLCVAEWAERSGTHKATICGRLAYGWPAKDAVFAVPGATLRVTPDLVREIRRRHGAGDRPCVLGREFGLSKNALTAIIRGRSWAGVA